MKIVIPCENGKIAPQFATADIFRFYVINKDRVIMKKDLSLRESGFDSVLKMMSEYIVSVVICDQIYPAAVSDLKKTGYTILSDVKGDPDEAVNALLYDELTANDHPQELQTGCSGSCSSCSGCGQ